ncbi:hypothetical protein L6164_008323 [Bauhinia variegata]|uniref:Uncharacterized protein n=1 Tax=Bauhinia variegata TaxID=167791 RepID=A0ACB9PGL5_BAUVA|nr:hypothetical protein L6164_008323 [Bauhinia variegata]
MGRPESFTTIGLLILLSSQLSTTFVSSAVDCSTVAQLFSACSYFISDSSVDPFPGSPCCDAMTGLNVIANSGDNRGALCRCIMGLIATYNPNGTAIATLPGFCGVSLGFTIDPNVDCNF